MPLCEINGGGPLTAWDIKQGASTIGVFVVNKATSADSGYGAETENWHWDSNAWADSFELVKRASVPDKSTHTGWETYPHKVFAGSVDLPSNPPTKTWKLARKGSGAPQNIDVFVRRLGATPKLWWWAKSDELEAHLIDTGDDELHWDAISSWPGGLDTTDYEEIQAS